MPIATRPGPPSSTSARRWTPLGAALAATVLAVTGNALQGSTPPPHGSAEEVVQFYSAGPDRIAVAMMLSLLSVFALAWVIGAVVHVLEQAETARPWAARTSGLGGAAAIGLLAGGFALNAAGALRAGSSASSTPDSAVVFYDGGLALWGLAAPLAMAVLLAGTAVAVLRSAVLPRWFGWTSAALSVVGLVTPVSFVLALAFPVWALLAGVVVSRRYATPDAGPVDR